MGKKIDCGKVNPASGCHHVVRGKDMAELMKNAADHVREHGLVNITPELVEKIKSFIEED